MSTDTATLAEFFGRLETRGDKPAIVQVQAEGARLVTYATLAADVVRISEAMTDSGLAAGDRVILLTHGGPDWITAFLAAIAAGAVPVPLDTQTEAEALRHIVEDSGARWAITDSKHSLRLADAGFRGRELSVDDAGNGVGRRAVRAAASGKIDPKFSLDDWAVLFYTSGTTGPPKGVPLTQRNIAFQLRAIFEAGLVGIDDRILQPLPTHHVYPLIVGTLAPLSLGLTIVIPEATLGPEIVAALRAENVSFIVGVPRLYEALIGAIQSRIAKEKGLAGLYLRSAYGLCLALRRRFGWRVGKALLRPLHRRMAPRLDVLASGGAALDPATALSIEVLGWRVASGYGLTETSPLLTINPPGGGRLDSVGKAVPGIDLRIDASVPSSGTGDGEGEILARGDGVFDGYLNHERNEESFTSDGWFRTRDLGRIDEDGFLYITGRRNTMLVTGSGKNIEPEALEQRYAEHELIEEIGLLMDGQQLAAVVVPAMSKLREQSVSPENAVRMALSQRGRELPSYKRVVRHVLSRDPLPRTQLGKVQRHRLTERYVALRDDPDRQVPRAAPMPIAQMSEPDRRRLEDERARQVWALLSERYPKHGLTPDTSLETDLGIDSLGWLELGTELNQQLGVGLDEEQIASLDTVRDLLELAAGSESSARPHRNPVEQPEAYLSDEQRHWLEPLSPLARRMANLLYAIHGAGVRLLFRLRVEGLEHLPADRQWILAPNHASFLDPSIVAAALPRRVLASTYWAGWTGYAFRNALVSRISRLAQIVPIDPERAASSSLAFAASVLAESRNLVMFPEGERSATGELLDLKPGVGLLAAHFDDVAVVPAFIAGSFEAWPRDRRLPRPFRRISITFGKPLDRSRFDTAGGDPAGALTASLTAALESLGARGPQRTQSR
jgi:long-chain acyl-CoA synthetase